jgi:hypothetical protein
MAKQTLGKTGTRPIKKPQPKPKRLCETCIYIDSQGSDRFRTHYCHRYPTTEIVALSYWCGEWRPKDD